MKKALLCGFFILLSSTLAHGITCYKCRAQFKDRCQEGAVKCDEDTDQCMTESVYTPSGNFLAVQATCATEFWRCGTTIMHLSEIQIRKCCSKDKCNGNRAPFPPPECAKPASE